MLVCSWFPAIPIGRYYSSVQVHSGFIHQKHYPEVGCGSALPSASWLSRILPPLPKGKKKTGISLERDGAYRRSWRGASRTVCLSEMKRRGEEERRKKRSTLVNRVPLPPPPSPHALRLAHKQAPCFLALTDICQARRVTAEPVETVIHVSQGRAYPDPYSGTRCAVADILRVGDMRAADRISRQMCSSPRCAIVRSRSET